MHGCMDVARNGDYACMGIREINGKLDMQMLCHSWGLGLQQYAGLSMRAMGLNMCLTRRPPMRSLSTPHYIWTNQRKFVPNSILGGKAARKDQKDQGDKSLGIQSVLTCSLLNRSVISSLPVLAVAPLSVLA